VECSFNAFHIVFIWVPQPGLMFYHYGCDLFTHVWVARSRVVFVVLLGGRSLCNGLSVSAREMLTERGENEIQSFKLVAPLHLCCIPEICTYVYIHVGLERGSGK